MREAKKIWRAIPGAVALSLAAVGAQAATIDGWNLGNVSVTPTPPDGVTGFSTIYDRNAADPNAVETGRIAYTPPEAISPGIKVQSETYTQGGPSGITLDGCIMTSNPGATCTSEFQSGKRVKQVVNGFAPTDLVFDVNSADTSTSIYQVFGRLVNVTSKKLAGFAIELGFGVGNDFVAATAADGISFSSGFRAQPSGSGSASSQFPFGLFGDAAGNDNFLLDGFFAPARTGFDISQSLTKLTSDAIYGPYESLFGPWLNRASVPTGLFWDFDNNDATDALLMAWETAPGVWEVRRGLGETCDVTDPSICTPGVTLGSYLTGLTFAEVVAALGGDASVLDVGAIEDLANLNLNYAIELGDMAGASSFTLRTTVTPAMVPLPTSAPLLAAGMGLLAMMARRRRRLA